MLKYGENVDTPYVESNWNSFDCVEKKEIKVILKLWDFEWNFSNQCQCHYFRNISFEVYIWVVISCHVILCCAVVYNFIMLGLYLILKFLEENLFKSALATNSNNQNSFFETTPPTHNFFFRRNFLYCTRQM